MRMGRVSIGPTRLLVGSLAILIVGALASAPAQAHHRPWPALQNPDRGTHTFCMLDNQFALPAAAQSRARYAMDNNDGLMAQTVVDTAEHASCQNSTDLRFQDRDCGAYCLGMADCVQLNTANRCDRWRLQISVAWIQALAANVGFEYRHTACHEIGHTVGLSHYEGVGGYQYPPDFDGGHSCMRSGVWDSGDPWTRNLGAHDRTAIAANW